MSDSESESNHSQEEYEAEEVEEELLGQMISPYRMIEVATTTCIHKYASDRMKGAEDESLPWPPIMIVLITYLNRYYPHKPLLTERNLAVLELLLDVPIQLKIEYDDGNILNLEKPGAMDFRGQSFFESLILLKWLMAKEYVKIEDLREPKQVILELIA